jgi:GNAT superfamily N-acetyltransferase
MSVAVRVARPDEVGWMVDLAAGEGWNPGLRDAEAFRVADPGGFLVAVEDDDVPVGCVSCVRYDARFAYFGHYLVVPERRGQGIGGPLFAAMLERAGDRTIGLDGVVAQVDRYAAAGFVAEHRTVRFRLEPDGGHVPDDAAFADTATMPFTSLGDYDRRCFPARRDAFLLAWTHPPGQVGRARVRDGVIDGYGVVRPCREGAKVGPLFAKNRWVAEALLGALLPHAGAGPVFLDAPDAHPDAAALARDRGGEPVFESVRMYRGRRPGFDPRKAFGLTTLELG